MKLIPKISLTDSKTWVEPTDSICISILEVERGQRYLEKEYFQNKTIILSGIIPDEIPWKYVDYVDEIASILDNRFVLTTADCATYESMNEQERITEINQMLEQNKLLFARYPDQKFIGIIAGINAQEYEQTYNSLKDHCQEFMVYLTGYIRANPRYFNLPLLLNQILPDGFNKPLICYGFNNASLKHLSTIRSKWNIQSAISESYRTMAVFSGGHHYRRETKMRLAWRKKVKLFSSS